MRKLNQMSQVINPAGAVGRVGESSITAEMPETYSCFRA
jgi:hypothetical protein